MARVGHQSHPLSACPKNIQRILNERWMEAFHTWRPMLRHEPCNYCGKLPFTSLRLHMTINTIDHIVPRSAIAYTNGHWDNLGTACQSCNIRRANHSIIWCLLWKQGRLLAARGKAG